MTKLVQGYRDEIDAKATVIVIQTVIPGSARQAARLPNANVEDSVYFDSRAVSIASRKPVGKSQGIPGIWKPIWRVLYPAMASGRCERRCSVLAWHIVRPRGTNDDRYTAGQSRSPDICRSLRSNQPLLAQRGAVVSSNRGNRCRIVKTNTGRVVVLDGDCYRKGGRGNSKNDRKREQEYG